MKKVWMEEKGEWLFDLAHGDLDDDAIIKGFVKHYVLQGQVLDNVQQDLHFRTTYGDFYMKAAVGRLKSALQQLVEA